LSFLYNEEMATNYTPIDDLVKKAKASRVSLPKEAEPMTRPLEVPVLQEVVEHEPPQEVREYVEAKPETVKIPPDVKKAGVEAVSVPKFQTYADVKLPITDDKVIAAMHQPITSSVRWLATLALYLLRQAHLKLKVIGGKVVRVREP